MPVTAILSANLRGPPLIKMLGIAGMLLREFLGEPDLSSYSVMMVDEAHEFKNPSSAQGQAMRVLAS